MTAPVNIANGTQKRAFTPARIVALAVIGLARRRGSPTSASLRDGARSPCRRGAGRRADPPAVQLRHGERQLRRRLRHAGRAREPRRSALAADRAAGDPHPGQVRPPGRADLPPRGRSRPHEHGVRARRAGSPTSTTSSSSATAASTAPSGSTARRSSRRSSTRPTSSARSPSARTATPSGPARTGSRTTASTSPATASPQQVDDLEAARVALGYDRIDLLSESAGTRTAMIYSWRHPQSVHRSVMIGVNPPGHFLWDREDDRRADRPLRRPLREGRRAAASGPTTSPRRCGGRPPTSPTAGSSCRSRRATCASPSFYGLMESTSEAAPLSAPMTLGLVALGGRRRRERVLVPVAARRPRVPEARSSGASTRPSAGSTPRRRREYFASAEQDELDPRRRRHRRSSGAAAGWPTPGRPTPDENEYSRVRTSNVETLLIGGELDFATPPQIATKELLPYLPNGHQVVLPGFGHTARFWTRAAGRRHPADQHLPRQRPGRRLALRAADRRLHARGHADGARQGHRRHDGRPRAPHGALAARGWPAGCTSGDASDARRARCCARCTRSCSAWADGSSAS